MRSVRLPRACQGEAIDPRELQRYRGSLRVEAEASLQLRKGTERRICPDCVTLALERLASVGVTLNFRGRKELFWVLQRVLHTTDCGALLPLKGFSSVGCGKKILRGLTESGLIFCVDPDSWKPTDYDFRNAEGRRYQPSSDLLLANAGLMVVDSAAKYLANRFTQRELTRGSSVQLNPCCGVEIPEKVIMALKAGTGFRFDLEVVLPCLDDLPEKKRIHLLRSGQQALTCLGNPDPLHTHWEQKRLGRLYASGPALLNLPKVLRPGLRGCDGTRVAVVDFNSFEFRILCSEAGVEAPLTDCAGYIAKNVGLERKAVKRVLNPMLHLQTQGNLFGVGNRDTLENRRKVERFLRREWPRLWDRIQSLRTDHDLLQRRGAKIFFAAYGAALAQEQLPAGIPMHDGWIFAAEDEPQVVRVKNIFEQVAGELLGQKGLVTYELLNSLTKRLFSKAL